VITSVRKENSGSLVDSQGHNSETEASRACEHQEIKEFSMA
jgi:hypothetical protein